MSNIEKLTISDVCDFIGGSQPPKTEFSDILKEGYIRFVQTRDFKTDNFITYIPKHLTTKFFCKKDIMIGRYGPPIFQIFRGMEGAYNVALLKAKPKKNILNDYLYYFLIQKKIFEYVDKLSGRTGGQTGVDLFSLYKYPINLPSIDTQKKISKVLSDLDAKIEINNRINTELEAMAKTLYDYWFVQFDFPDANGKPYKTSGGKMVWNNDLKREIPEGWKNGNLDDLGEIIGGSTPSKAIVDNFCSEGIPWITPKDLSLNSGKKFITKGELDVSEKGFKSASLKTLPKDSILLSSRAPIGYMVIARNDVTTNQGFKSFVPSKGYSTPFIFYTIKNNMKVIEANASGSTFKEISGGVLKSISVCLSNKNIIDLFTKKVESIFKQQDILEQENQELASLRDWLLPMLMNGQVSVGDVAEELGMVAEPVVDYKETKTNKTRTDKSEAFLKKVMLGCHLVYRFHQEREFGHIKFMKLLYLCEQVGEMNLMTNYQKAAAGPFDKKTLASIEKYIQTSGWFKINKEPYTGSNGKVYERTFYSLTGKSTDYQKYYNNYFESEKDKIEKLIQLFKGANSRKCEIVATMYYAYNELLKKNALINENSLIKGFFEFHPQKGKNFKEFDVKEQLPWMKNNGVYPKRQID